MRVRAGDEDPRRALFARASLWLLVERRTLQPLRIVGRGRKAVKDAGGGGFDAGQLMRGCEDTSNWQYTLVQYSLDSKGHCVTSHVNAAVRKCLANNSLFLVFSLPGTASKRVSVHVLYTHEMLPRAQ